MDARVVGLTVDVAEFAGPHRVVVVAAPVEATPADAVDARVSVAALRDSVQPPFHS